MRNMKKYIYLFIMLVCIMSSCTRPEDGLVIPPSINANLTRFRVYRNIYFDATIDQEAHTVSLTIPEGIDKTTIRPEIIVSEGAVVTPASGAMQDFTNPVEYTVVSPNGETTNVYTVTVNY